MGVLATTVVLFVALLHTGFLVLEMFLWTKPMGRKVFRNSEDFAGATRVLAANQGLYNGFLAAGLFWSVLSAQADVAVFFLGCVVVAGVYAAVTVNRIIFYVQAAPALLGLVLLAL